MKTYVSVSFMHSSPLPSSIYFNKKRYEIKEHISSNFINGITVCRIKIGERETLLYHEEIPRIRRWYVYSKNAA